MNYLKITSKGFHGYNGQLNIITFRDGVSTEPVPPLIADRIAASMSVVACDKDGNTGETPVAIGIQHRLIAESASRAPVARGLARQTDEDRVLEEKLDLSKALAAPGDKLYTQTDLETIVDKGGIKALREIGKGWKVTGRSIPELVQKILAAQSVFISKRNAALEKKTGTINRVTIREAEAEVQAEAEEVPTVATVENLPASYSVKGEVVVTDKQLIERALKNSGKTLTGWNALTNEERQAYVDREIQALEIFHSVKLTPAELPVEEKAEPEADEQSGEEAPAAVVEGSPEFEALVQEALNTWEPKITEEDAIALVRKNLAEKLAAKEA